MQPLANYVTLCEGQQVKFHVYIRCCQISAFHLPHVFLSRNLVGSIDGSEKHSYSDLRHVTWCDFPFSVRVPFWLPLWCKYVEICRKFQLKAGYLKKWL